MERLIGGKKSSGLKKKFKSSVEEMFTDFRERGREGEREGEKHR